LRGPEGVFRSKFKDAEAVAFVSVTTSKLAARAFPARLPWNFGL